MLHADSLSSFYGKSAVIQEISFDVAEGDMLAVLGRNGVGKTTLLRTFMGLTDRSEGELSLDGVDMAALRSDERAMLGIGYVPQGRGIIPNFTVRENLTLGTFGRTDGRRKIPSRIHDLFPILSDFAERRGGDLSGGQQQQLAIGRALAMEPRLLLLDEPTEGIQPNIVSEIEDVVQRLNVEDGLTVIIVEQNIEFARRACTRYIVMDKGKIVTSGAGAELTDEIAEDHLTF